MEEHRQDAPSNVKCAIITLSDSKFREHGVGDIKEPPLGDESGRILFEALKKRYDTIAYRLIPDSSPMLISTVNELIKKGAMVIFTTGGTGIGSNDITIETLREIFEKELEGFGEIFRYKSYEKLGAGAILSRATAGLYKKTVIIALPGSPNAVKMGLEIIMDELGHLAKHARE